MTSPIRRHQLRLRASARSAFGRQEAGGFARGRARPETRASITIRRVFGLGFVGALGALVAYALGTSLITISTILMYVVAALFVALALDPLVSWLERKHIKRPFGIALVFSLFTIAIVGVIWLVVPAVVRETSSLIQAVPGYLTNLQNQDWFVALNTQLSGVVDLDQIVKGLQSFASTPSNWFAVAGGVFKAGEGIVSGVLGAITTFILSLYFLSSLESMKRGAASLVPGSLRRGFLAVTNQITASVSGYVNGMILLAAINASLGFVAMSIIGVPFPAPLAIAVFCLAIIPLIGSVLATILVTIVGLFNSPETALAIAIYYLIFMQVEAYVMTPRVMSKTVSVPGALVVIGALAGGTMLGILGALIAVPVTASILIIIKQVVVPRQDLR